MQRLRTVELHRDANRTLLVIESIAFEHIRSDHGSQHSAILTPLVIIVCAPEGNEVLVVEADKTGLEDIRRHHPELDELIAQACRAEVTT